MARHAISRQSVSGYLKQGWLEPSCRVCTTDHSPQIPIQQLSVAATRLSPKGGTAINLFYRGIPQRSVDIDLIYLPIEDRETTPKTIDTTLEHIREGMMRNLRGASVQRIAGGGNNDTRLLVRQGNAEIKVETSPVARGTLHSPERRRVSESVEKAFRFAEMQVVSFEDLFGGKLHAIRSQGLTSLPGAGAPTPSVRVRMVLSLAFSSAISAHNAAMSCSADFCLGRLRRPIF